MRPQATGKQTFPRLNGVSLLPISRKLQSSRTFLTASAKGPRSGQSRLWVDPMPFTRPLLKDSTRLCQDFVAYSKFCNVMVGLKDLGCIPNFCEYSTFV
jgi:hypothetical protein